ncbi:Alpha/beta hydrolase domain-containing protein 17C [Phytophthora nicotianae]|uniref:Alpha/beta hydrolase domain-containing protein 17C n=1 Tax=Phytophthora nicotianae TaxID=4792 RepID=A0A0W8DLT1_PHYNI|nr:Alpha/beta hydrolase domain-containing protein 17C [Phytophthora nicotianae]
MNVWALDTKSVAPRVPVKKTFFADEVEVVSTSGWGDDTKSQRRKQRGKVEFLVEDQLDSDDAHDMSGNAANSSTVNMISAKANQISSADVVEAVDSEKRAGSTSLKQERQRSKEKKRENPARSNQEIAVHHLVREFLLMHCHDDVVRILDKERSMPQLGAAEVKQLSHRLTGTDKTCEHPPVPSSLLERFLACSNEAKVKARVRRSATERSVPGETTSSKSSPTSRRKPELNVITSNLDQTASKNGAATPVTNQGYNRLNHPGSTPHHGPVVGEPGSTPMPRSKDLHLFGFEEVDDDVEKSASDSVAEGDDDAGGDTDQFSHYALQKRTSKTGLKRVQLGDPGSTPTKEYIFFRETPPSFVTETIEDAVEIFEKLGNNPEFVKQAVVVERFIELQSSEVSKYTIGQVVEGLGAQSNINGVVSKIYGSRLCGTAGQGTIVIDTCPEQNTE